MQAGQQQDDPGQLARVRGSSVAARQSGAPRFVRGPSRRRALRRGSALGARLRGISPRHHSRLDPADLTGLDGHPRAYVEFTHPLCSECRQWEEPLRADGETLITFDVRERHELARKYGIAIAPTVFAVGAEGTVLERLVP